MQVLQQQFQRALEPARQRTRLIKAASVRPDPVTMMQVPMTTLATF